MQAASDPTFNCPHCQKPIHLTEALARPLVEAKLAAERQRITAEVEASAKESIGVELERLQADNRAQKTALDEARKKQIEVLNKERELAEKTAALDLEVAKRLAAERETASKSARAAVVAEMGPRLAELQADCEEKARKLAAAQNAELALRQEKTRLEEERREWDLEKQRQMDAEKAKVREQAQREFAESHRLKEAEKDKVINDLRVQMAEWQRKAEQGSQQLQGEVQELDLEATLQATFPLDALLPVPKGVRGADCLQRVSGPTGAPVGTILWECKRTRAWSDTWLPKLRSDQRESRADVAILVTTVLPDNMERFGFVDGVWITDRLCSMPLAQALRFALMQAAAARTASTGRETKMELLYAYLCGPEFRARVEGIVEAFTTMSTDLAAERRATEKQWAKREKQIDRVLRSTSGMYGDLQGIAGSSLPELPSLRAPGDLGDDPARALPGPASGE